MAVRKQPFHPSTLSYISPLNLPDIFKMSPASRAGFGVRNYPDDAAVLRDEIKSGEAAFGAIATRPQAPFSIRSDTCM